MTEVLFVGVAPGSPEGLRSACNKLGMKLASYATVSDALSCVNQQPVRIVFCESALRRATVTELVGTLQKGWPGLPVILLGTPPDFELSSAVAMGVSDYVEQPDEEPVEFAISKALQAVERSAQQGPPPPPIHQPNILGQSPAMVQAHETISRAALSNVTVLVRGESGTGKELAARAVHQASPRANKPLIKVDCASLPENLLESELFGYEKGAFTGAAGRKIGKAELANGGTLFLDEIGELPLVLQAKLLRLLQDRQIERLGGTQAIPLDVRIVAATHRDLEGMVERKEFRLDLFYRLNVVPVWLPPLRARRDDIAPLAQQFCDSCAASSGQRAVRLDESALKELRSLRWPGNVRQLQNFIERLVVLGDGSNISAEDVRLEMSKQVNFATQPFTDGRPLPTVDPPVNAPQTPESPVETSTQVPSTGGPVAPLTEQLRIAEKRALERALRVAKQNRSLAARLLGVSRSTFYAKLAEHGLL